MAADPAGVADIYVNVRQTEYRWVVGRVRWALNPRAGTADIYVDVVTGVARGTVGGLGENEWGGDG